MFSNRFKFTKTAIKKLPLPAKKKATYHDTEITGFKLDISPAGTYTFYIYRKVDRKPERIKIGNFPTMTVEQARILANKINADIANGINPNELKRKKRAEPTLQFVFDEYLERHAKVFNKRWKDSQWLYDKYIAHWKNQQLSAITQKKISLLHIKLGKENGHHQANRVLELLKSLFNRAIEWGLWEGVNPAIGVKKYPEKSRDRFLQADEIPKLFEALAEEENDTLRDYILLSLFTGARKTNVLAMAWKDINLKRKEWKIPETKNGETLLVPLVDQAVEILQQRKLTAINDFVFYGAGKTGHMTSPNKGWKRILKRAGIEDLRLHDLRRSLGSWQASTGANLSIIGKTLGHKNVSTTAIYARLNIDPIRESMSKAVSAIYDASQQLEKADVVPIRKNVTIPIDYDVLEWFEAQGAGYQNSINRVLREHMTTCQTNNATTINKKA